MGKFGETIGGVGKVACCISTSTQLSSSLLTKGSRMAKTYTVHKNKPNDQSE